MSGSHSRRSHSRRPAVQHSTGRPSGFLIANVLLLLAALTVGGASRENLTQTATIELVSLALLPWTIYRLSFLRPLTGLIWPLVIAAGVMLVPVIQLIPLPSDVWTALPGRGRVVDIYAAADLPLSARPISLTADFTLRSALSVIPPITIFLGWTALSWNDRRFGVMAIMLVVLLGLVLGAVQLASGSGYLGYLYTRSNQGSLVGFFANRNHQASLLLCALPLMAALVVIGDRSAVVRRWTAIACLGLTLAALVALAAVKSRAGILLLFPALLAGLVVLGTGHKWRVTLRTVMILGGLLLTSLVIVFQFGLRPILERFEVSMSEDSRFGFAPPIWAAAKEYAPWGTGIGSFDPVYRSIEPLSSVGPSFLNHAHNDYLELFLEGGLLSAFVFSVFLAWFFRRTWSAWSTHGNSLARAGSVVIVLLLVHSAVDYPLRTLALSAVFAFATAMMVPPLGRRPSE